VLGVSVHVVCELRAGAELATAALVDNAALVTRNVRDFSRVPGLRVLSY
jgi:predicted nucleic acid-binding protein